ncbi:kinase-like domain-containing protein, partial [Suillus americanus]
CAILQCKRIHSSETDNSTDLQAKLETLHLAQYFLDSFYRRAETNGVHTLPKMRWNISGAFIGKLIGKLADALKNGEEDSRSLVFSVFMVLPLLPTGALCQEIKFSGSEEVGVNHDSLGSAVDAYAHHVIVDSMYEIVISDIQGEITSIVFFDPQCHTSDLGYWDRGQPAIDTFMESHKCNKFCKALSLEVQPHTTDSQSSNNHKGPLRIGFDS